MPGIKRTQLDNGVTVISEWIPGDVVSCGLWFREGSSAERNYPGGISHVLEHMLFKGTQSRSAFEISSVIEGRGGMLNAGTSRCDTCFYCSLLAGDWRLCLEVLSDMALNSSLEDHELQKELSVIRDEIRMVAENPEDELGDLIFTDLYPDQIFGLPVQGSEESVSRINTDVLRAYHSELLRGNNLVVALCGPVAHHELRALTEQLLGKLPAGAKSHRPLVETVATGRRIHPRAAALQNHIHLCCNGPLYGSKDYTSLSCLSALLGEGMSSRLFQDLREENALCYNVFSWLDVHDRISTFGVYLACDPDRVEQSIERVQVQFRELLEQGPSEEEVERTRQLLLGALAIASEQSMNRLMRLARRETAGLQPMNYDDIAARIQGFRREDLADCAKRWLRPEIYHESQISGVDA